MDLDELRASRSAVVTIADATAALDIDARTASRAVQNGERLGRRLIIPRGLLLGCLGATESPQTADPTPQDVEGERLEARPSVTDASPAA